MDRKKITIEDWTEIGKYNYAAKWIQRFCRYDLIKEPDGRFKREQRIGLIPYCLMFIPVHILQFFYCLWDGGLKEFEFAERYLGGDWLVPTSESWLRAEKVWNRK